MTIDSRTLVNGVLRKRRVSAAKDDLSDAEVDWMATIEAANADFAAPALLTAILRSGLSERVPLDVLDYLTLLYDRNERCNQLIREQCLAIGRTLAAAGISGALLKGAAWLFDDGPSRKDRMMRDIDILIAKDEVESAMAALRAAGYHDAESIVAESGHIHRPAMIVDDGLANLEVHVELTTRTRMLEGREVLARGYVVAPGLLVPTPRDRIVHNVLHAQIVNGDYDGGSTSLRDSIDLSRLVDANLANIDWAALAQVAKERGYFRYLSAAIHKATRFAGSPMPSVFANNSGGWAHALRCDIQRRVPVLDQLLRRYGTLRRALAWERDSYALGLGADHGPMAHIKVNRRRASRGLEAIRRSLVR